MSLGVPGKSPLISGSNLEKTTAADGRSYCRDFMLVVVVVGKLKVDIQHEGVRMGAICDM